MENQKQYTSIVNGENFNMKPTYAEMDDQVLMQLADQMFRELASPINMNQEVEFILKAEHMIQDTDSLPFTNDDITNNQPTANLETLTGWEDMTEEQRDELVEEYQEKLETLDCDLDCFRDELSSIISICNSFYNCQTEQEKQYNLTRTHLDNKVDQLQKEYDKLDSIIDDLNDAEFDNYPEIMQWILIDDRLLYRLEEMGECTLDDKYWGRCAFGQSITMDHCIKQACYDLAMCWKQEVEPPQPTKQPLNSFNDCK